MTILFSTLILLAAAGIVSWPLFRKTERRNRNETPNDGEVVELLSQKDAALFALNELQTDFETGCLSPDDYKELKNKYEEKAVALIRTVDEMRGGSAAASPADLDRDIETKIAALRTVRPEDDIEAGVLKLRKTPRRAGPAGTCTGCGTGFEPGTRFCFRCGLSLNMTCPACLSPVGPGDRFCAGCGTTLAVGG